MRFAITILVLLSALGLVAQTNQLEFEILFDGNKLELNKHYFLDQNKDTITISRLRFYISDIKLISENEEKALKKVHHLVDLENDDSRYIALHEGPVINQIEFKLGVDSLTNMMGAQEGDLDPMHGMYWSWNSGYINFKLEGTSPSCPTRKNEFNFHIGGFLAPYNAIQTIYVNKDPESKTTKLVIQLDLRDVLNELDLKTEHTIMSPSKKAVQMADNVKTHFILK